MNAFVLGWIALGWLAAWVSQGEPASGYSETYVILIDGSRAGMESVTEMTDRGGNLVASSEHELYITDGLETKRLAFKTTMVLSKNSYAPIRYSCNYTSGETHDSYELTVTDGVIKRTLTRAGHSSEATGTLRPGVIIVDFNVYHQYALFARLYDPKIGGRQVFQDYIPLIGNEIPVAVTQLESSALAAENVKVPVRNYSIEFVGIMTGTLSVDETGRLVRLVVPAQRLQVVRGDLLPG